MVIRKVFRFAASLVAASVLATLVSCGQAEPASRFQCTLEAAPQYTVGQPVEITFSLANTTSETWYVLDWYTPLEGIKGEIFAVTRDGAKVQYQGMLVKRGDPSREDYVPLGPGETVSATVDLSTAYDLSTPGKYDVEFTSRIRDFVEEGGSIPRTQGDHREEELSCNTISVEVVR